MSRSDRLSDQPRTERVDGHSGRTSTVITVSDVTAANTPLPEVPFKAGVEALTSKGEPAA